MNQQIGVENNSNNPDYSAVNIPAKPPTEYSYVERRAELLQQAKDLGHPSAINQSEQAERYGVSQQQISKDMDRIAGFIRDEVVDRDRRAFTVNSVLERSIQGLLEEGEWRKAARTAIEWDEWLTEFHDLEELHRKLERIEEDL